MDVTAFLSQLQRQSFYHGQIVHLEQIPRRSAKYGALDASLHPDLQAQLRAQGIERLFTHQAEAINAARAGRHVVVVTSTASGKTLCYNLPVLEAILAQPVARALYLFPTKALAQDQLRSLRELGCGVSIRLRLLDQRAVRVSIRLRLLDQRTAPSPLGRGLG
jgi:DEAD/DEAH box helicase domain-containing protein